MFHPPMFGICQKRRRELQLGCGRAGHDARLRGHDDAVCPIHVLRARLGSGCHSRAPDLHQDEPGRRRRKQVHHDACRRLPLCHRRVFRVPRLFRLSRIETEEAKPYRRSDGAENNKQIKYKRSCFKKQKD